VHGGAAVGKWRWRCAIHSKFTSLRGREEW
jgi:hypothetical protein